MHEIPKGFKAKRSFEVFNHIRELGAQSFFSLPLNYLFHN